MLLFLLRCRKFVPLYFNSTQLNNMKIEIWSDVMCPFCYIGKRKFESALNQFEHKDQIEIVWKRFQLAPDMVTDSTKNIHEFLAAHKGMTIEQAKGMNNHVANMAKQVGLDYNFDKAIPANSFLAHQFSHLAYKHNLQGQAEEALFKAYFTDGKNIDDINTLVQIGTEIGLAAYEITNALNDNLYANEVRNDIDEARQIGVNGVPFFVFDRKVAVSGAQDSSIFLETIENTFAKWSEQNPAPSLKIIDGNSCGIDSDCN